MSTIKLRVALFTAVLCCSMYLFLTPPAHAQEQYHCYLCRPHPVTGEPTCTGGALQGSMDCSCGNTCGYV